MSFVPDHGRRVLTGLWEAAWPFRRRAAAALLLLVLAKLAAVGTPLLLKAIIDRLGPPVATALLDDRMWMAGSVLLLLGYAVVRFGTTLFTELRDLVFAPVTKHVVASFAERTFAHLLHLGPRFHLERDTGALIRDVERGTRGIGFLVGAGLFTIVPTLVELLAVLLVMAAAGYSTSFTAIILATYFVYGGWTTLMTQRRAVRQRRVNEIDSRVAARLVDSLINVEAVAAQARESYERARHAAILAQWVDDSVANQRALSHLHIGQGGIIAGGVAAVMVLAGSQAMRGQMTVGDLVLVNAFVLQLCLPLNAFGFVFREARDALVDTERLFMLLDQRVQTPEPLDAQPLEVRAGEIAFEHVDFAYEPGRPVLHDLNLTIAPGCTVAVVGGSGSGKSTLVRLLLRLYDPTHGRVVIDGQDLRNVRLASLRRSVGVVPQDMVLFNDTIAFNIGYGREGASMDQIVRAAQAAQVHEFVQSLSDGYDTVVGERGLKLSGGEKQRLAIARMLLQDPPLRVLDEATSALDARSERAIQQQLARAAPGRTTLIVAHRLSTVVEADEIVVLDGGRIVERGRHDRLLAHGGLYAQLWNLQQQQQQVERVQQLAAQGGTDAPPA
jgi:ATP-binding cassette subfamily B protein